MTVRVLIADDQPLFRQAIKTVLSADDGLELVGEASDGEEVLRLAEEHVPDVVLMDVQMPKLSGIEATQRLRERLPAVKVVMLTISDADEDLFEAIKAGASGYLLKDIDPDEVGAAIHQIQAGQSMLSPGVAGKLLTEFAAISKRSNDRLQTNLTPRELEILQQAARGLTNRQIGRSLHIAENTVKNHIRNILEKLHMHSRMEAVLYAMREKLLDLE